MFFWWTLFCKGRWICFSNKKAAGGTTLFYRNLLIFVQVKRFFTLDLYHYITISVYYRLTGQIAHKIYEQNIYKDRPPISDTWSYQVITLSLKLIDGICRIYKYAQVHIFEDILLLLLSTIQAGFLKLSKKRKPMVCSYTIGIRIIMS